MQVLDGKLVERSGGLNVLQSLFQVGQFLLDKLSGFLSILQSLSLESLNGLNLLGDVVRNGLEGLESGFDLVNDILVLQNAAVVSKVDLTCSRRQFEELLAGIVITLAESLKGRHGGTSETEGRNDLGPIDLNSRTLYKQSVRDQKKNQRHGGIEYQLTVTADIVKSGNV